MSHLCWRTPNDSPCNMETTLTYMHTHTLNLRSHLIATHPYSVKPLHSLSTSATQCSRFLSLSLSHALASPPQFHKSGFWGACSSLQPFANEIKWRQQRKGKSHPCGSEPHHEVRRSEGLVIRALRRLRGPDPAQRYCHHDDQARNNLLPRRQLKGSVLTSPFARGPSFGVIVLVLLYISLQVRTKLAFNIVFRRFHVAVDPVSQLSR